MEPEPLKENTFSLKSPFHQEAAYKIKESFFQNSKWKQLLQKDKILLKLSGEIMQEGGFLETLDLFESNTQLSIPEDMDPRPFETIAKYMYLKEIPNTKLPEVFPLLQLAFFLKVNPLIIPILEYLITQIKTFENNRWNCFFVFRKTNLNSSDKSSKNP